MLQKTFVKNNLNPHQIKILTTKSTMPYSLWLLSKRKFLTRRISSLRFKWCHIHTDSLKLYVYRRQNTRICNVSNRIGEMYAINKGRQKDTPKYKTIYKKDYYNCFGFRFGWNACNERSLRFCFISRHFWHNGTK